jgi:hypothetical protein
MGSGRASAVIRKNSNNSQIFERCCASIVGRHRPESRRRLCHVASGAIRVTVGAIDIGAYEAY